MSTSALTPTVQEVEVKYALAQVPDVSVTSRTTGAWGCVPSAVSPRTYPRTKSMPV